MTTMRGGLRIGRLHGIDVVVDWSWSLVFLLMTWNLTVVFHQWHASWPFGATVVLAIVATLLFFGSLLAHEFAHSLIAQSYGMKVKEIRIFLFGGVSNIEREPPSAAAELWMAIAGPLTSIGLGIVFFALAGLALPRVDATNPWETLGRLGPLATLFFWLGPINVIVGVFNLVPAFPLDGGRVLRAALWWATGSMHKATVVAGTSGRAIGWAFVVTGVAMVFGAQVPLFGGGAGNGIWLAFIGWFLQGAAANSVGAQMVYDELEGVRVRDLMRTAGPAVPAGTSVRAVAEGWFLRTADRAFPVVDGRRLVGIVSIVDLQKIPDDAWARTPVDAVMTPREKLALVTAEVDAGTALRTLLDRDVHQLPVLGGRGSAEVDVLAGMLFGADVMRWVEMRAHRTGRAEPRLMT